MRAGHYLISRILWTAVMFAVLLGVAACGNNKDTDQSLNGVWSAKIEDPTTQEKFTYYYEFDGKNVKVLKTLDSNAFTNTVEMRFGTYKKEGDIQGVNQAVITYDSHSCLGVLNNDYIIEKEIFRYQFADTATNELKMSFGLNKTVTFQRVGDEQVEFNREVLKKASVGCFVNESSGKTKFQKTL